MTTSPPLLSPQWAQVPDGPLPRRPSVLAVWALTVVPLTVALAQLDVAAWRLVLLAVVGLTGLLAVAQLWRWRPAAVAAGLVAGAALAAAVGVRAAAVAVASAVVWWLLLRAFRRTADRLPERALRPAVVPMLAADVLLLAGGRVRLAAVAVALAAAACAVGRRWPGPMGKVADLGARGGHWLGTGLAAVAMVPAALVVLVMSVLYRLVRFDPLRPNRTDRTVGPRWRRRSGAGSDVEERVGRGARRRRSFAGALGVLAVVAGCLALLVRPPGAPLSAAFTDPSWPDVWAQQQKFNSNPEFNPTTLFSLKDFSSPHVNQVDGRRRVWQPPPCDCPRRTVWWFGGSAAWGFYLSDEQSVPSQLAKAAWSQGVALEITNFALPGYSLSQEMQLFAQLAETEPPPDLAVFYDGANELFLQVDRNNHGQGTDESPVTYADRQFQTVTRALSWPQRLWGFATPGSTAPASARDPLLDAPEVAGHAMARYRRQVALVDAVAAANKIPVLFVWQPTMSTAPAAAADEWRPMAPADAEWHRRLSAAGRAGLPDQVLDLSDVFDTATRPVFPDWAHTNAAGATTVAAALVGPVTAPRSPPAG